MSAFMVSKKHIDAMVTFCKEKLAFAVPDDQCGQVLVDANVKSLVARYGCGEEAEAYVYEWQRVEVDLPQFVMLIKCFQYQACEFEGWATSEACQLTDSMLAAAACLIPGVEEAEWTI